MTRKDMRKFLEALEKYVLYGDIHEEPIPKNYAAAEPGDDEANTRVFIGARLNRLAREIEGESTPIRQSLSACLHKGALKRAMDSGFDVSREKA